MAVAKVKDPVFKGKTIVILSPQPWDYLSISKHHYAKIFAKENNVFFVAPPATAFGFQQSVRKVKTNLNILELAIPVPQVVKFKARWLYRILAQYLLKKSTLKFAGKVDFCFDFGWYQEFDSIIFFPASCKIYFPVDDYKSLSSSVRGSDFTFTVSKEILRKINSPHCHFINHGLSEEFSSKTQIHLRDTKKWVRRQKIRVGYSGNLFIPFLDIKTFETIIRNNPEVEFNFYGSDRFDPSNQGHQQWSLLIHNSSNVKLHGFVTPELLSAELAEMDIQFICYKPDGNYHGENSHKIMEYLSTGMVTVSSHISLYSGTGLLEMPSDYDNSSLPLLFSKVVSNLEQYNSPDQILKRRKFALENTYEKNVERIGEIISAGLKNMPRNLGLTNGKNWISF